MLGYNFLKGNDLFSSSNVFYSVYNNVDGLSKSNAVVINGFKVGQVTAVTMLPDKRLLVEFEVKSDVHISKYDTCRIMAND
ncbi:MAG: MCE family protein, partial [Bacteroidetes bacterium]|nr:MCE family protein [Bacteroidota bacterium]